VYPTLEELIANEKWFKKPFEGSKEYFIKEKKLAGFFFCEFRYQPTA
jgi:hypothetical protein